ncbi:hypothetical protein NPIL_641311 [Nephila pilipes]|uniref:BHLH domain-containing protein n=1 Tax=Nephila pilipes TaxID=299642 RepID=A0A8X6PKQ1_NEPPI|nr:hypothetical protein NPIL_641311 [Nephila pilipes]
MSDSDWSDTNDSLCSVDDDSVEVIDVENDTDKRQYHNQLERKRRDKLKDSFDALRKVIPSLRDSNVRASRYQVLKECAKFIKETDTLRKLDKEKEENLKRFEEYIDEFNALFDKYTADGDDEKMKQLVCKTPSDFGLDSDEFNALSDDETDSESNSETDYPPSKRQCLNVLDEE